MFQSRIFEVKVLIYDVSIIVPTFNELANVSCLISSIENAMSGIKWEVIFVDDNSPDKTYLEVKSFAEKDARVRCIRRVGRKGLSSASIEGMLSSSSKYVAVMDADLQHDEQLLSKMFCILENNEYDLVIGSRYVEGGSTGGLGDFRTTISKKACDFCEKLISTGMKDPMSGFFMLRRSIVEKHVDSFYGKGFKILLDIVSSIKPKVNYIEIPYKMRARKFGESKLGAAVVFEYFMLVFAKFFGNLLPAKFILFCFVGLSGVLVYISSLGVLHRVLGGDFTLSAMPAVILAMTSNFFLNNMFTFSEQRLRGRGIYRGLLSFYFACSVGAIISIALSSLLNKYGIVWWLSAGSGIIAGSVWNYSTSSIVTWKKN